MAIRFGKSLAQRVKAGRERLRIQKKGERRATIALVKAWLDSVERYKRPWLNVARMKANHNRSSWGFRRT
jgi:hypothetical protein